MRECERAKESGNHGMRARESIIHGRAFYCIALPFFSFARGNECTAKCAVYSVVDVQMARAKCALVAFCYFRRGGC